MKKILRLIFVSFFAVFLVACNTVQLPEDDIDSKAEKVDVLEDIKAVVKREFPQWIAMWEGLNPAFDISTFKAGEEQDIMIYYEMPYTKKLTELEEAFFAFSPDGTKYVDPYSFMYELSLDREADKIKISILGGEPDVQVRLIDLENNSDKIILSCGTPCGYDKAIWLDDNRFIVVASGEDADTNKTPDIYLFDLSTNRFRIYQGAGVTYEIFQGGHDLEKLLND